MLFPQNSVDLQLSRQPSPDFSFPSSQISPGSNIPLPHFSSLHNEEHLKPGGVSLPSHSSTPALMAFPQPVGVQFLSQPSPSSMLPSSQTSPKSTTPLPQ